MGICLNRFKEKEKHLILSTTNLVEKLNVQKGSHGCHFHQAVNHHPYNTSKRKSRGVQVSRPAILCWKLIYPHIEFVHNSSPPGQQETMFCGSPVTKKPGGFHMKESRTIPTTIHDLNAFQSSLFVLELHHDHTLRVILIHLQTNNLPISGTSFTERLV
jgi:hypothetical protein